VLALSGCSASSAGSVESPRPSRTSVTSVPATAGSVSSSVSSAVSSVPTQVDSSFPSSGASPFSSLIGGLGLPISAAAAEQITQHACVELRSGESTVSVIRSIADANSKLSLSQVGSLVGSGVSIWCPDQASKFE
jgi:hypothetical protein